MKKTKRKGFNFFRSYYDVYNMLPPKDKIAFIDALLDRQFLGVKPDNLEGMAEFAYVSQTNSIDSQVKGYEDKTGTKLNPLDDGNFTPTVGVKEKELTPTLQVQVEEQVKEQEKVEVEVEVEVKSLSKRIITMPPNKNLVEDFTLSKQVEKYGKQVVYCYGICLSFFPEHLHPKNKNTWLDTIEKLNRIDGVPFLEIERIVKAVREDTFWGKNFLSMTKLRKKKDEVYYIVIFGEKFKPKEITHNRQTQEVIEKNLTGWGKKQN
jgi:hypothetical protein